MKTLLKNGNEPALLQSGGEGMNEPAVRNPAIQNLKSLLPHPSCGHPLPMGEGMPLRFIGCRQSAIFLFRAELRL